jgi:hypothetical protein
VTMLNLQVEEALRARDLSSIEEHCSSRSTKKRPTLSGAVGLSVFGVDFT